MLARPRNRNEEEALTVDRRSRRGWMLAGLGLGTAIVARAVLARPRPADLWGRVALVTGGSRGLGFLLAREFAQQGCRIAICARDAQELDRARLDLERAGAEVFATVCDITDRQQVERMVHMVNDRYGRVDILVNNAGIIQVGPLEAVTEEHFRQAMDVMFWGMMYVTRAVLPQMQERREGRIVNITSIGGKVSVPHMIPYSSAKFAAVGFSEGLHAELMKDGITVTTIVPGLMRTGGFLNALYTGDHNKEFGWFALAGSLPLISMDAEAAARQIVDATRRGQSERILGLPASLQVRLQGLFPGLLPGVLGWVNWLLPRSDQDQGGAVRGKDVPAKHNTMLGRFLDWDAVHRLHETDREREDRRDQAKRSA